MIVLADVPLEERLWFQSGCIDLYQQPEVTLKGLSPGVSTHIDPRGPI